MLIFVLLGLTVLAKGISFGETELRMESSEVNWTSSDWIPETGKEIPPIIDVEMLGDKLRKRVHQLKSNKEVELIFLIDSSSSIGEENFKSELKFVQKVVADFNVGPSAARVAITTFASNATTHVNQLEQEMHEKCSFLHVQLPGIEYTGGNTNTIEALLEARKLFDKARKGADKALFLVTDGFSNKGDPVPAAKELRDSGITIFTFGIQSGNVREVREMSSIPTEDYSFIVDSFSEFEALAHRALHEDLQSGSYMLLNDTRLCDRLCSSHETGCCNNQSRCSCGILTGHFACLCPPGFYGSGLVGEECLPCPKGTFSDGSVPGDILVCMACPDSNQVTKVPASSEKDCFCRAGFVGIDDKCEVTTCPVLKVPTNGYFVKKNCSNVVHAACGVRCSTGYMLQGSSIRVCQANGTWSGIPPKCIPKSCRKPKPVRDSTVTCKNEDYGLKALIRYDSKEKQLESIVTLIDSVMENSTTTTQEFNYTVDTVCAFNCIPGYTMIGSKTRTCLPILQWNGLSTSCTVLSCPSLSLLKDGSIKPENCTTEGLRHDFATECSVSCRPGYKLEGPSLRNCTGRRGTWTGKNVPNKCIDVEPPVFKCPENITVETIVEESYALVHLSLPDGTDNSGLDPIIWSKPPFLPDYPLLLKIGTTKIEVYGTDASDNGDLCEFYVQVQDNEIPKVFNCESPPSFYISDLNSGEFEVNWTEPIFTDNSVTPLKIEKSHEFGNFSLGTTTVIYTATDASGNRVNCTLNITVEENPCKDRPSLGNVEWNCTLESNTMSCRLTCPPGLTWTTNRNISDITFMCQYDRAGAKWNPDIFNDPDTIPECSAFELPTEIIESHEIELEEKDVLCDDLETLSQEISKEINVLMGTEETTRITIIIDCIEEDEQNKTESVGEADYKPFRAKRSRERKKINIRVSLIGSSSNVTSTEVAKHLHELGQKVHNEYSKNSFISIGGKQLKIQKTKTVDSAKLRCNPGFTLKWGLCVKCPSGTFYDSSQSNCIPCPIGKFQNLEGQLHCESCPAGHLTRNRRSKQEKDCKKICPPGTFGKIKKKQRKISLMPCRPCPIGTYQPSEGQTSCTDCPAEMTTTKKGSTRCIAKVQVEDPCYGFTCQNNGTCFVYNGFPYCLCTEGYLGSFCERQQNHCDSSPCYNNAECVPIGVTSFNCICQKGYEGDLCQFEVNECAAQPCANGGECIDIHNGYKCECLPGFAGENCEENINECEVFNNPCFNNGTCNDLVNSYSCTCQDGFSGKHCEEITECVADAIVDKDCNMKIKKTEEGSCTGVTCPDNMECAFAVGTSHLPVCKCKMGFYGRDCSQEISFNVILTFPKRSVTEYLTADFPEKDIHQVSVCLWIQTADLFNYGTLFSYAVKDVDNSFTITDYNGHLQNDLGEADYTMILYQVSFVLYIQNKRVVTDIKANDGYWHFICITWDSKEGSWEIYLDGKIKRNGTGLAEKTPIPGRGRFIIGQEQDRYGGGFNEVESFVGKITNVDVWDRVLQKSEIEDMNENCKYFEGDMFSWVEFLENIHGNVEISKSTFCTNCNPRELRLLRGKIRIENIGDSTFGVYECDTGYRINLEEDDIVETQIPKNATVWYRKCLKNGNWEQTVPKCNRVYCDYPGRFPHGTISGESYFYSDVVAYQCDKGYTLVGNSTRMCLENGTWSGDPPICKGHSGLCEEILAPRHGSMFVYFGGGSKTNSSGVRDRAEFICDQGYRLRGPSTLKCLEEGLWDQEVPVCEEISCNFPAEIEKYLLNTTRATYYTVGEKLFIKCKDSVEEIIECLQNGEWNHTSGLCGTKCRGKPYYPEHGLLLGDPLRYTYEPGETVAIKCRYGFWLFGDNFFVCSDNGTWDQRNKTICKPVECAKPLPPPNSYTTYNYNTYPYGRRVMFKCSPGHKQLGELQTRCDGEGNWTRIFGRCVAVFCKTPIPTHDMKVVNKLYKFGDKLKFECLSGKAPSSVEIVCEGNARWSEIPRCL